MSDGPKKARSTASKAAASRDPFAQEEPVVGVPDQALLDRLASLERDISAWKPMIAEATAISKTLENALLASNENWAKIDGRYNMVIGKGLTEMKGQIEALRGELVEFSKDREELIKAISTTFKEPLGESDRIIEYVRDKTKHYIDEIRRSIGMMKWLPIAVIVSLPAMLVMAGALVVQQFRLGELEQRVHDANVMAYETWQVENIEERYKALTTAPKK